MINIIIAGPPGSGKGTLAKIVVEKYNLTHFSTGDMLRQEVEKQHSPGARSCLYIGKRRSCLWRHSHWYDYPRTGRPSPKWQDFFLTVFHVRSYKPKALDKLLKAKESPVNLMILLDLPDKICIERILRRRYYWKQIRRYPWDTKYNTGWIRTTPSQNP